MKVEREIKQSVTKGDIVLISGLVLLSVLLFVLSVFGNDKELTVKVYSNSEIVYEGELSMSDGQIVTAGGCEILIEKDGVSFTHSLCSDKLCIKRGKLNKNGDTMACVPQRVVVVISEKKDKSKIDVLTY